MTAVATDGTPSAAKADAEGHFRPDIQGLRAIAVVLVVVFHTGVLGLHGGYVGVDVFYVISGFLITGQLLRGLQTRGRVDFAGFFAKRARRILPASFTVLLLTLVASAIWLPPVLQQRVFGDAIYTALYIPNFGYAIQGTDYLAETAPSPYQHYWSLGVEEQFYLVLPVLLMVLWLIGRRRVGVLTATIAVLVVLSFALGWWLTFVSPPWAFFSLPARAWELGIGSLLALLPAAWAAGAPRLLRTVAGWAGLALILAGALLFDTQTPFPGWAAAVPTLGAAAVIWAGTGPAPRGPVLLLRLAPFQLTGKISYSWYLIHWPLMVIPAAVIPGIPAPVVIGIAVVGFGLGWVLYHLVEDPVRRSRALAALKPSRTLLLALTASLLSIALAVGGIAWASARPVDAGRPAPTADPQPTTTPEADTLASVAPWSVPPVFTGFVPSDLAPSLSAVADDVPRLYPEGCHLDVPTTTVQSCSYGDLDADRVVALFGDSHAAQWFPALEALGIEEGFRVDAYTKSSCPSVDFPISVDNIPYTQCDEWRAGVVAKLAAAPPDVVVIANMSDQPDQPGGAIDVAAWGAGLERTITQLGAPVLVIGDTPRFAGTPAICLSAHVEDTAACAVPRSEAVRGAWHAEEERVALAAGAEFLDVTDVLCDAETCGLIVGNVLLYRDATHLTATASDLLAPVLGWRLGPMLAATAPTS